MNPGTRESRLRTKLFFKHPVGTAEAQKLVDSIYPVEGHPVDLARAAIAEKRKDNG